MNLVNCVIQNYTDTQPPVASGAPVVMAEGNTTATLLPWQALECIFTNDNTSFINITKITTMPVDGEHTDFSFNGTFAKTVLRTPIP